MVSGRLPGQQSKGTSLTSSTSSPLAALAPPSRYRHWVAGMGVAFLGLVVSLWLAQHQAASMAQIEEARFTQETRAFAEALSQRIAGHTEVVNGLRGLFTANPRLSRLDFERAASEMEVGQRYPGVRNLSFTRWVPGREREAYEARVRADTSLSPDGLPQFKIHPPGERAEYFVAEYLWPMFGNEGVLGLDISAQPANLAAMRYSRDSGQTVVSAPFDLLQETTHRAGIVIRVPVFDPTAGTAEQRFVGAVASTLRVYDLVQGLGSQGFLNGIAVAMADLGPVRPDSGDAMVRPLLEQTAPGLPGVRPLVRELGVHDRRWQLTFYPTRSFLTASETRLPWLAGLAAAVVSLLLASVVALLVRQRTLALVRAQLSDDARRESEERFRALFNQATVGVAQVDSATGQFVRVNQRYADILGYSPEEMVGMTFQSLTHPDDLAADLAQVRRLQSGDVPEYRLEKRYIHKDGHEVWGDLTVSSMWASGSAPGHHIAVVQDITARKRMEENLRANEQRLRSILERLPMGLCLVQDDGLISFRNQRYVQICGYTQEEVPDTDTWWQRAYPDAAERDAIRQRLLDTRHLGVIPLAEYTIRCADGKYKPVEISGIFVEGGA